MISIVCRGVTITNVGLILRIYNILGNDNSSVGIFSYGLGNQQEESGRQDVEVRSHPPTWVGHIRLNNSWYRKPIFRVLRCQALERHQTNYEVPKWYYYSWSTLWSKHK